MFFALMLIIGLLYIADTYGGSNTINYANLTIYGLPKGTPFLYRVAPNYTIETFTSTGYNTTIPIFISNSTNSLYHGKIPWQEMNAGTAVVSGTVIYQMVLSSYNQTLSTTNKNILAYYVYLNSSLWTTNEIAELEQENSSLNSAKIILGSFKNNTQKLQYGNFTQNGNYVSAGSNVVTTSYNFSKINNVTISSIQNINTTVVKAKPKACININLISVPFCSNETTPLKISVPVFNGHYGLTGNNWYPLNISFSSKLIGNNTANFNYTVYDITNKTYLTPYTSVTNTGSVNITENFKIHVNQSVEISFNTSGNSNYSKIIDDPVTVPTNINYYLPINFYNYQPESLTVNSVLLVGVNSINGNVIGFNALAYQQYETCNLNNIEPFYSNGTTISGWIGGNINNGYEANSICTSDSSTNALANSENVSIYLKIGNNAPSFLPAGSTSSPTTNTIYLGFAGNVISTSNNLLTNSAGGMGEAPQLSCANPSNTRTCSTYGEYDNGGFVFSDLYANFSKPFVYSPTAISGGGWSSYCNSYCSTDISSPQPMTGSSTPEANVVTANMLYFNITNGECNFNINWANSFGVNTIFSWYGKVPSNSLHYPSGTRNPNIGFGFGMGYDTANNYNNGDTGAYPTAGVDAYNSVSDANVLFVLESCADNTNTYNACTVSSQLPYYTNSTALWTTYVNPTSVTEQANFTQTNSFRSSATGNVFNPSYMNIGWGVGYSITHINYSIQYIMVYPAPPNGISPQTTYGAVTNFLVTISPTEVTLDNGQSNTLTAIVSGGAPPYTYQWYSGTSSTCSSDTTALGTSSTQSISPSSSTYYCVEVNQKYSKTVLATVNPALNTPTLSPTSYTMDSGQVAPITASATGGTAIYSYKWYSGTSPTGTLISGVTVSTYYPTATGSYYVSVTDSATTPETENSLSSSVTVNPALGTPTISPSNPTIDNGQSLTFTSTWSGGTTDYTAKLYSSSTSTCNTGSTLVQTLSSLTSGSSSFSSVSPTSTTYYCIFITDSATTPETSNSINSEVVVNPAQIKDSWTASNSIIDGLQSQTLTVDISGGTSPYTYNYLVYNSANSLVYSDLISNDLTTNSIIFEQNPVWGTGTFMANIITTDSATTPTSTTNSLTYTVSSPLLTCPSYNVTACYPIYLANLQTISTGTNFQQMITLKESNFPSLQYNTQNTLANFQFEYPNGTTIPAWIEGNSSSTLTTFLNISSGLQQNSNTLIYLVIKPTNQLNKTGKTGIGEAPQLTNTYAQYDDGKKVFNFYDNFYGTTLNTSLWDIYASDGASGSLTNIVVNNGLTITADNGYGYTWIESNLPSVVFTKPRVWEMDMRQEPLSSTTFSWGGTTATDGQPYSNANGIWSQYYSPSSSDTLYLWATINAVSTTVSSGGFNTLPFKIYTIEANTTPYSRLYFNNIFTTSLSPMPVYNSLMNMFFETATNGGNSGAYINWIDERSLPPKFIMPSVTFGAGLSPSTSSGSSVDNGQKVTVTANWQGGTAPYTLNLYYTPISNTNCYYDGVSLTTASTSSTTYSFTNNYPLQSGYYCVNITDSATTPVNTITASNSIAFYQSPEINSGYNITIENTQTSSISANTQILIGVNTLKFNNVNANTYNNIELSYNGVLLNSWMESNSVASNVTLWTKLPVSIPASSNVIIQAIVAKGSNSLFNAQTTGEAPQLSSNYAQYDNGWNLFNFYSDFKGIFLNKNKWNNYASSGTVNSLTDIYVDNGITLTGGSALYNTYISSYNQSLTSNTFMDLYFTPAENDGSQIGYISTAGQSLATTYNGVGVQYYQLAYYLDSNNGVLSQTQFGIYSIQNYLSTLAISSASVKGYLNNYVFTGSTSADINPIPPTVPLYLEVAQYSSTYNTIVTYVRTRSYPNNFVLPTIITSNTITDGFTASYNSIKINQVQTLTANVAGGVSPYTYNFLVYNSIGDLVTNDLVTNTLTSNSFSFTQLSSYGIGNFIANVIVTDSNLETTSNSLTYKVIGGKPNIFFKFTNGTIITNQNYAYHYNGQSVKVGTYNTTSANQMTTLELNNLVVNSSSSPAFTYLNYTFTPTANTYTVNGISSSGNTLYTLTVEKSAPTLTQDIITTQRDYNSTNGEVVYNAFSTGLFTDYLNITSLNRQINGNLYIFKVNQTNQSRLYYLNGTRFIAGNVVIANYTFSFKSYPQYNFPYGEYLFIANTTGNSNFSAENALIYITVGSAGINVGGGGNTGKTTTTTTTIPQTTTIIQNKTNNIFSIRNPMITSAFESGIVPPPSNLLPNNFKIYYWWIVEIILLIILIILNIKKTLVKPLKYQRYFVAGIIGLIMLFYVIWVI